MRTMLNSLFVVVGMSAAFVAGFWTRDQIAFYRDTSKDSTHRSSYNRYAFTYDDYRTGYSRGYSDGRRDYERKQELKEEYGEEEENEDI